MRNLIIIVLGILSFTSTLGQTKNATENVSFVWDNDMYFFKDRYYTNGLQIAYSSISKQDSLRTVKNHFQLNHEMYTPRFVGVEGVLYRDRPYAGAFYLDISKEFVVRNHSILYQGSLGYVGPTTYADRIQTEWHNLLDIYEPMGWHTQIESDVIIGALLNYKRQYIISKELSITPQALCQIGTYKGKIGGGVDVLFGKCAPHLHQLDISNENRRWVSFFGYSGGMHYRLFDATLQGGVFSNSKVIMHKSKINPIMIAHNFHYNVQYGKWLFTLGATFWNKEYDYGAAHQFGTIKLTYAM